MEESRLSFEHFACLASSAANDDQNVIDQSSYASHEPLCDIDKGYELYELSGDRKRGF